MRDQYLLAVDQGTSGTKAVIFDSAGKIAARGTLELKSFYPEAGFVEQDPFDIYRNVIDSVRLCLNNFSGRTEDILGCGISNQRETIVLWDHNGEPLANAIVWQCKRSVDICNRLKASNIEDEISARTGLIIDPYFSGTKIIWLYENNETIRREINNGNAYMGTVDTWLLFKLTGGHSYFTDYTNASRTLFFNINTLEWDDYLLDQFNLKNLQLPQPSPSTFPFGYSNFDGLLEQRMPILAMIGDSHAAAFGEGTFAAGNAKATMGTGASILMNTGSDIVKSLNGMVSTICWSTRERVDYALEGMIVSCGATIKWLRDQVGLFEDTKETEDIALKVDDNNGVYILPAFGGLAAPYWRMDARAMITGLTFGCNRNHLVRAALESVDYQIKDIISAMENDSGIKLEALMVDGGLTGNLFVMQFLADLLRTNVINIGMADVSALGAAYMAGLECGVFKNLEHLSELDTQKTVFSPGEGADAAARYHQGWLENLQTVLR